ATYTLSLHDALPICTGQPGSVCPDRKQATAEGLCMSKRPLMPGTPMRSLDLRASGVGEGRLHVPHGLRQAPVLDLMCSHFVLTRSEEHTSELQSREK